MANVSKLAAARADAPKAAARRSAQQISSEQSTKTLLMGAGEQLIARHGFDGVTLRDIAELAGQANSSVVQYHFKDKSGLIEAIFEDRMRRREALRKQRLNDLKAEGRKSDPRGLLEALWLPSLAFKDGDGKHVFCHFALQCLLRADMRERFPTHEIFELGHTLGRGKSRDKILDEVLDLLLRHYSGVSAPVLARRLSALSLMFISNVVEFDNLRGAGRSTKFEPASIIDMALLALSAPSAA
jgi:AcrR family transcriptional regulator